MALQKENFEPYQFKLCAILTEDSNLYCGAILDITKNDLGFRDNYLGNMRILFSNVRQLIPLKSREIRPGNMQEKAKRIEENERFYG